MSEDKNFEKDLMELYKKYNMLGFAVYCCDMNPNNHTLVCSMPPSMMIRIMKMHFKAYKKHVIENHELENEDE